MMLAAGKRGKETMPALWFDGLLNSTRLLLPLAAIADYVIGDPWNWVHPVQVMGWGIRQYSHFVLARIKTPLGQRWAGVFLGTGLPVLSGGLAATGVMLGGQIHPVIGNAIAVILLASCLAGRSLRRAGEEVLQPLQAGDLPAARAMLSRYVGRDTDTLSPNEIYRALLETLSENAVDGVLAPLFYALLGMGLSPAAAVGCAIAYKALSTLDSMVGYRTAPYTDLGWCSAKLEDLATWLPCRCAVLTIALLSGRPRHVLQMCRRDAPADPSPNAGWSECAYAAALGVQLGGLNTYGGEPRPKPLLGEALHPIDANVLRRGMGLTRWAFLLWLLLGTLAWELCDRAPGWIIDIL